MKIRKGYGFSDINLRLFLSELCWICLVQEHKNKSFKKYRNWCQKLADFNVPSKIQLKEYSMSSGADSF